MKVEIHGEINMVVEIDAPAVEIGFEGRVGESLRHHLEGSEHFIDGPGPPFVGRKVGGVGERRGEPSREQVNTTKTKVAVAVLKELDECDLPALEREMSSDEG
jgi:hypothetical protein